MKFKKVIAWILITASLSLALAACKKDPQEGTDIETKDASTTAENGKTPEGPSEPETPEPGKPEPEKPLPTTPTMSRKVVEKDSENVESVSDTFLTVGRTYIKNEALVCEFAGTGIRFTADCEGSVFARIATEKNVYFTVYVDGVRKDRVLVKRDSADSWSVIATGLEGGVHEIELVKQSQFTQSSIRILEVGVIGTFGEAPEKRDVLIEFYGDSIINGSNIFGGGTSISSTDATSAFGWLAAKELNADCNLVGCDGLGLAYSNCPYTMEDIWDANGTPADSGKYDFVRVPDIVVIELGVNDAVYGAGKDIEAYRAAVEALIANIRAKYGSEVPIVWLYGYHDNENWANTEDIIFRLRNSDKKLYACEMPRSNVGVSDGGDGNHPDVETTKALTEKLVEALKPLLTDNGGIYGAGEGDDYAKDFFR